MSETKLPFDLRAALLKACDGNQGPLFDEALAEIEASRDEQTRAAYYKGRDYGKRAEFDKREKLMLGHEERSRIWKARALQAEGELRAQRGQSPRYSVPEQSGDSNSVQVVPGSQVVTLQHIRNVIAMRLLPGLDEGWADAALRTLDNLIETQQPEDAVPTEDPVSSEALSSAADAIRDELRECASDEWTPESLAEVALRAAIPHIPNENYRHHCNSCTDERCCPCPSCSYPKPCEGTQPALGDTRIAKVRECLDRLDASGKFVHQDNIVSTIREIIA